MAVGDEMCGTGDKLDIGDEMGAGDEVDAGEEVESGELTYKFLKRLRNAPRLVDAGLTVDSTGSEVPTLFWARNASKRAPLPRLGRSILYEH